MSGEDDAAVSEATALQRAWGHLEGKALIAEAARRFAGGLAVISSFGAESAVLLDLVAQVDAALPVLFVDTCELFDETLAYRDTLVRHLGLTNVRAVRPTSVERAEAEDLWRTNPDRCCHLRKVAPLARAMAPFSALIDGRKRAHGFERATLSAFEAGGRIVKISPLWSWTAERIEACFVARRLPRHPLVAQNYRSIGCWPCTRPVAPGEPARAGRWAGSVKTECGIHRMAVVRSA